MDYVHLSKEISYALRHAPYEFGLELDDQGYTSINLLLAGLNHRGQYSRPITENDILEVIRRSPKRRLEIKDGKIRALYGHSTPNLISHNRAQPPNILYHGTAHRFLDSILATGLKPMKRQYVHLSETVTLALDVGARHDARPVVLAVDAKRADNDGIPFYQVDQGIWLANAIPRKYLTLLP